MPGFDVAQLFIAFSVLLFSVTVHEVAHAWMADRLGDATGRRQGRISLNPLAHADLVGTVLFPVFATLAHVPLVGWARPVPIDGRALRRPRRDRAVIAAAGTVSHLLLAVVAALILAALPITPVRLGEPNVSVPIAALLSRAVQMNLMLAIFHLLPIPPLDGGTMLTALLPLPIASRVDRLRPYAALLLVAVVASDAFRYLMLPPYNLLRSWLP
ncbi:MAG: site-2 protease family protein [Vicinamibacterales bacterium]